MPKEEAIITLTTDFGYADPYIGIMKGVILSLNSQATIVDISHEVRPQCIEQAAFLLASAFPFFPPGSIHVAVVDPGVGTARRPLAVQTPVGTFLGPDNGVLSAALPEELRAQAPALAGPVTLPARPERPGLSAIVLTNQRYFRHPVSATFHGRDIFAPAAAHLSLGVPLTELGETVDSLIALPPFHAAKEGQDRMQGRVLHIDRFGNLLTNIHKDDLPVGAGPPALQLSIEISGQAIRGLKRTYAEGGALSQGRPGLIALIGSTDYLEIASPEGNAALTLNADIGTPVTLYWRH